jgi:hypothetical protein
MTTLHAKTLPDQLLEALKTQLTRGSQLAAPGRPSTCSSETTLPSTVYESLHELLKEGLASGQISEVFGKSSSGKTSLALALVTATLQPDELAVWIDLSDSFDPSSAQDFGVELQHLLWVRSPELRTALRCAESVLRAPGFGLVILDFVALFAAQQKRSNLQSIPRSAWFRLQRAAEKTQVPVLLLSEESLAGPCASLALQLTAQEVLVSKAPNLVEGLRGELRSLRVPGAPPEQSAILRLSHGFSTSSIKPDSLFTKPVSPCPVRKHS